MNDFKVGDLVWCKDKGNCNGYYTATYFHRPCFVEICCINNEIVVRPADSSNKDSEYSFLVDGNLFEHVKTPCKVV